MNIRTSMRHRAHPKGKKNMYHLSGKTVFLYILFLVVVIEGYVHLGHLLSYETIVLFWWKSINSVSSFFRSYMANSVGAGLAVGLGVGLGIAIPFVGLYFAINKNK